MTKIFDDLEIVGAAISFEEVEGEVALGCLQHSGIGFVIRVKILSDAQLISTVCHELQHYDLAKVMLKLRVIRKTKWRAIKGVFTTNINAPEWIHSEPSYLPEDLRRRKRKLPSFFRVTTRSWGW
jgi:hypothetical protein